jgi:phytoene/squalene synthetase
MRSWPVVTSATTLTTRCSRPCSTPCGAFDLDPSDFERFLDSMAMDLHTGGWSS